MSTTARRQVLKKELEELSAREAREGNLELRKQAELVYASLTNFAAKVFPAEGKLKWIFIGESVEGSGVALAGGVGNGTLHEPGVYYVFDRGRSYDDGNLPGIFFTLQSVNDLHKKIVLEPHYIQTIERVVDF